MENNLDIVSLKVQTIERDLYGNGQQPGRFDKLDRKLEQIQERVDISFESATKQNRDIELSLGTRITTLESKITKIIIVVSILAQASGQLLPFISEVLK